MPSSTKTERDEDLAVKPINPLIDLGLGLAFIGLLIRLAIELIRDTELGLWFLGLLLLVVAVLNGARGFAKVCGRRLSKMRRGAHIPCELRDPLRKALPLRKFADQFWQLTVHVSMTLYELYLISGTTIWHDPPSMFDPCPAQFSGPSPAYDHPLALKVFYLLQLAIWVWTGFSCKWLEARRKDYLEMMAHHIFTVALVLGSMLNQEHVVGLVVLLIHDSTDVILDSMKLAHYMKMEGPSSYFLVETIFVTNLATWAYGRLYRLPVYVIYQGTILGYLDKCAPKEGSTLSRALALGSFPISNLFLLCLVGLHIYWFLLLCRILLQLSEKTPTEVGRQEYEGLSGSDVVSDNEEHKSA